MSGAVEEQVLEFARFRGRSFEALVDLAVQNLRLAADVPLSALGRLPLEEKVPSVADLLRWRLLKASVGCLVECVCCRVTGHPVTASKQFFVVKLIPDAAQLIYRFVLASVRVL